MSSASMRGPDSLSAPLGSTPPAGPQGCKAGASGIQETRTPVRSSYCTPWRDDDAYERVWDDECVAVGDSEPLTGAGRSTSPRTAPLATERTRSSPCLMPVLPMPPRCLWCASLSTPLSAPRSLRPWTREARRLAQRLERHDTPTHGSWVGYGRPGGEFAAPPHRCCAFYMMREEMNALE